MVNFSPLPFPSNDLGDLRTKSVESLGWYNPVWRQSSFIPAQTGDLLPLMPRWWPWVSLGKGSVWWACENWRGFVWRGGGVIGEALTPWLTPHRSHLTSEQEHEETWGGHLLLVFSWERWGFHLDAEISSFPHGISSFIQTSFHFPDSSRALNFERPCYLQGGICLKQVTPSCEPFRGPCRAFTVCCKIKRRWWRNPSQGILAREPKHGSSGPNKSKQFSRLHGRLFYH